MTPDRALHRDHREDIEALAHRGRIILPAVILPDGTASPDQVAIVPPGVDLARAFLPHRELAGPPTTGPGAAIVGTRQPEITPYLPGSGTVVSDDARHRHITRPQSRDAILAWLYDITGVRYAPAAFWRVAGWEIGWVANWLDRLFTGGTMGELIVAERQAAAAVRAAWIAHQDRRTLDAPLVDTGILLAARAVVDMLAAFQRAIDEALCDRAVRAKRHAIDEAHAAILQRLRACVKAIEQAATGPTLACDRHRKAGRALDHARDIVDSIGLFTAVSDPIGERVVRITEALPTKGRMPPPLGSPFAAALNDAATQLEAVIAAGHVPVTPASWCEEATGDLSRLCDADPQARHAVLAPVRTDLVYKLVVTRRLDRLFEALPWMAAPSGAFRQTYGGPLGAVGSLFEIARHKEVALELTNRTFDSASGPRLDTHRGKREYRDPAKVRRALRLGTRAGFWLATSALSHHMVQAFLAGKRFDPAHPLPTLQAGRLDWSFERAMHDPATMADVTRTELAKPIYASSGYRRDLAVYMGLGTADLLAALLIDAFPGELRGPGCNAFTRRADDRREAVDVQTNPFSGENFSAASRELLRSMLKSLDTPTDGIDDDWRSGATVNRYPNDLELRRFDDRHEAHNGHRISNGSAVRRRASEMRKSHGDPGKSLRNLVARARSWIAGGYSDDRPLVAVLSGRSRLGVLTPVAQTSVPALWFFPGIDTPIHDWIADTAPMWQPLALGNVVHGGLVAREVQAVAKAMPLLFGMPVAPALRRRILVPLWTGLATVTSDHAHVR
ncbi:hypothetical protein [Sphingomonas sp. Leaf25]|uniref:hypothetical protein n=1 Tax=Sphingomonas sp. Leaf25 TaxID=1735692 RepID=UPI0006F5D0F4|nr:hypothetical protein [Sphingomonas sp. Leaf25]KQM99372.1 hypothetical protein ASE78_17820 [Sphingomonas sp. Leaf25]